MITLCGFGISNYYNKVKMVLLEKGLPFQEEMVLTGSMDDAVLACTPLGKVPFIRTEHGALCESQAIVEYLEAAHPEPRLLPADPWAAAKVRELVIFLELHLELVARELYGAAFAGGSLSAEMKDRVHRQLVKNIAAFKRLARFGPYLAGEQFTLADCAAFPTIGIVGLACKAVYGEDLVLAGGIDVKPYLQLVGQRPSAQRVTADRKADQERARAMGRT